MNLSRKIILVSGSPGAGKTTLAKPLAESLGFALISKDAIKETLAEKLDIDYFDLQENRILGGAAMEVMWKLAESCPQLILEANFRPRSEYEKGKINSLAEDVIEVYCRCSAAESCRRFAERAKSKNHHPVHIFKELPPEDVAQYGQPIGIGKLIEVNTEEPVDIDKLILKINKIWSE